MAKWRIGSYLRYSADEKGNDETTSITNQRSIIKDYLFSNLKTKPSYEYADDGYTGTDFDRPSFQKMLYDIEKGKINTIIVKDLSRLGRSYIDVGDFFEETIPTYNIRFISIGESIDSYLKPESMDSIELHFNNIMNENYSRDVSKKVRSTKKTMQKNGEFTGSIPPYGYIKDDNNCHKLIIDKEPSKIIKRIFNDVLNGKSKQEIIADLNRNHIMTPSMYLSKILKFPIMKVNGLWTIYSLDSILKNEVYIGNLVQGKTKRISHKVHDRVRIAEEDWIKVKDTHNGIIDNKIFEQVQKILYNRNNRVNNSGKYNTYTGYLKCADCGGNLFRFKRPNSNKVYYYCGNYIRQKTCSKHYILESEINEIILNVLNKEIHILSDIEEKINNVISLSSIEYSDQIKKIRKIEIEKEINKYETLIDSLLIDYQSNYISEEDFNDFKTEYLYELNNLKIERDEIDKKSEVINLDWIEDISKHGELKEINRKIVELFIDNIFVYDNKDIKIDFRFKNEYEDALKYLKSENL